MELIPEWAPNLHPMVVHFPIAILGVALIFDFLSFFLPRKRRWWSEEATALLYAAGAASAVAAYYTGTLAADSVMLPADAQPGLSEHADLAWITVWFYGLYAAVRLTAVWWAPEKHRLKLHVGFFLFSLVGLFYLYETGEHGAEMVFKHGVGVEAATVENPARHEHSGPGESGEAHSGGEEAAAAPVSFNRAENGDWAWNIESNALAALQQNFRWLSGSAAAANAEVTETGDGHALSLSGQNLRAFFSSRQSYPAEQVDYYVDLSAFDGTVMFASHVQDRENYDFVSVEADGTVRQGRMEDGEARIFEEGTVDQSRPLFVRVVGNGTHFRGYVNEELVVHGHGDAPAPGGVGLRVDGSGTVLLNRMALTQLGNE